jgi:hypothetical protein
MPANAAQFLDRRAFGPMAGLAGLTMFIGLFWRRDVEFRLLGRRPAAVMGLLVVASATAAWLDPDVGWRTRAAMSAVVLAALVAWRWVGLERREPIPQVMLPLALTFEAATLISHGGSAHPLGPIGVTVGLPFVVLAAGLLLFGRGRRPDNIQPTNATVTAGATLTARRQLLSQIASLLDGPARGFSSALGALIDKNSDFGGG